MARVTVIGGGPAGSYTARELTKRGHDVIVFEDHHECGDPIQCTGILTHVSNELIDFDEKFVDNYIHESIIFAPNGKFVDVKFSEPNIIVNRTKYDQHLMDLAVKEGAELRTGHRYLDSVWEDGKVVKIKVKDVSTGRIKYFKTDYLVGADGPNSPVAKTNDMFGDREFFIGAQARVKIKHENQILFYPYIEDFAWAVPEGEGVMRIGIASRRKTSQKFKDFLKRFDGELLDYQGGPIPIYNPRQKTQNSNVFLVGDAATHVKATTGGGIIQAMTAARSLGRAIDKNPDNPPYEKEWRKAMGKDLLIHLWMRKVLDEFSEKDWNRIVDKFSSDPLKSILEEEDRDRGLKIAVKCIIRKPSLGLYGFRLLSALFSGRASS